MNESAGAFLVDPNTIYSAIIESHSKQLYGLFSAYPDIYRKTPSMCARSRFSGFYWVFWASIARGDGEGEPQGSSEVLNGLEDRVLHFGPVRVTPTLTGELSQGEVLKIYGQRS